MDNVRILGMVLSQRRKPAPRELRWCGRRGGGSQ